jgi:hypothetical protein
MPVSVARVVTETHRQLIVVVDIVVAANEKNAFFRSPENSLQIIQRTKAAFPNALTGTGAPVSKNANRLRSGKIGEIAGQRLPSFGAGQRICSGQSRRAAARSEKRVSATRANQRLRGLSHLPAASNCEPDR